MTNRGETYEELPLTEATLLILLSLAPGPKHGYGILKEVEVLSHGRIVFSTGTLYGALKRLLAGGWIERFDDGGDATRDRKAYVLTETGRRILNAELSRMKELLHTAQRYVPDIQG